MALVVEITQARLLPNLIAGLERSGCRVEPVGSTSCTVVPPPVADLDEARLELAFFLRAWQLQHPGVGARIYYEYELAS